METSYGGVRAVNGRRGGDKTPRKQNKEKKLGLGETKPLDRKKLSSSRVYIVPIRGLKRGEKGWGV